MWIINGWSLTKSYLKLASGYLYVSCITLEFYAILSFLFENSK